MKDTNGIKVLFVGNGRDYHSLDVIRNIRFCDASLSTMFATDCLESEGYKKIITPSDNVKLMFLIDGLLSKKQYLLGDKWRNFVKLLLTLLQASRLRSIIREFKPDIVHAFTFYYGLVCSFVTDSYYFSPQGSELTARPADSWLYRRLMRRVLGKCSRCYVDSEKMASVARELGCGNVIILQLGIDTEQCLQTADGSHERSGVVSNRGLHPLYRILSLLRARSVSEHMDVAISFIYPFWDESYRQLVLETLEPIDKDLGRVSKLECYRVYGSCQLVVSIPETDSSPRSVYEAIFCGALVAVCYDMWVDALPSCMKSRIYIIDLTDNAWFGSMMTWVESMRNERFQPNSVAIDNYDQYRTAKQIIDEYRGF